MKKFGGWGGALLLGVALGGGCGQADPGATLDGGLDGPGEVDAIGPDGSTDVAAAPTCAWDPRPPELKVPEDEIEGVLRGTSRNASTTCTRQKGTGGPEAIYLLRLDQRSLVELEVVSEIDTVLAIRRVCDDPLTELACNDAAGSTSPPQADAGAFPSPLDAAAPFPGGETVQGKDARLRASLPPGAYFVVVDEAEPFGVGGAFQLTVRASAPPAQTSCSSAQAVGDGSRLAAEELELASETAPCGDGEGRPALFYRAAIPSGQRIVVRALPVGGDRPWTPVIRLFTSCQETGTPGNLCLASDRMQADGQRALRYVNNGPTEQQVLLSVSATELVRDARFRLEVGIAEPLQNVTCASASPLSDGLVLRNQDLSEGQVDSSSACKPSGAPSLFYSATLFPQQSVRLAVATPPGGMRFFPVLFLVREGCSDGNCAGTGHEEITYFNGGPTIKTVIIEATTFSGFPVGVPFDLQASMPLPPGGISVQAARGLTTTEAGGKATFTVRLTSPGIEPVDLPITSGDPAEGTVSPSSLRFTADNWDKPQTVTVTGADDDRKDGNRGYTVAVGPAVSQDRRYAGLEGTRVTLLNRDDEPGFSIEAAATLVTSESGAQATFRVVLNRAPLATVRLALSSSNEAEGKVSPAELVFEPSDWNQPQTATVVGIEDDGERDGSQVFQILTGPAVSADPDYDGIDPGDLPARNSDNDFVRVAAQVVSGDWSCVAYGTGQRVAVDQASNIYAGMICQPSGGYMGYPDASRPDVGFTSRDGGYSGGPTALVAVSDDGGRTFRAPVDTGMPTYYELVVAAGRPGLVVVAGSGPSGVTFARSEDGGASWQPTSLPVAGGNSLRLAASGNRVALALEGGMGPTLLISEDGGATFTQRQPPAKFQILGMGMDAADGRIWIVGYDGQGLLLRTSGDGGATFEAGPSLPMTYASGFGVGPSLFFLAGMELLVVPRDGSASPRSAGVLSDSYNYPHSVVVDEADNATVITSSYGRADARRLAAGDTMVSTAKNLGGSDTMPSGAALSDSAVVVLLSSGGRVSALVETWP